MKKMMVRMACGLCNRLRTIAPALWLCRQLEIPLAIDWRAYSSCPEDDMSKLFEIPDGMTLERADVWINRGFYATTRRFEIDDVLYLQGFYGMGGPRAYKCFCVDGPSYTMLQRGTIANVRALQPVAAIRERIEAVKASWPEGPIVGVHVRRTDFSQLKGKHTAADKRLVTEMNKDSPDTNYFVASDNPGTVSMLRGFFGGRIHTYTRPWLDKGTRKTTMDDAVVDLYALGATTRIIGVQASSFSKYAAWLGGAPVTYLRT